MMGAEIPQSDNAIHAGKRSYPLPGYARRTVGNAEVVAETSLLDEFCQVVEAHNTLYSWARHQDQPRALSGRAPVYIAGLNDLHKTCAVVRHSWHGGLFAPITGDRFLRPTRAPLELLRSFMLRECSIPTPEVLGFALYNAGPLLARVDVATRYVDDAHDFASVLAEFGGIISRGNAYTAVQTLLVQLAAFGFTHPDLNVKNILLYTERGETMAAVLDVDVMQWDASIRPADIMLTNVARLARSMRKSRTQFGVNIADAELNDFVARMLLASPAASSVVDKQSAPFQSVNRL